MLLIYKTALHLAIKAGNPEIVQLLLNRPEIDVNSKSISKNIFFKYHFNEKLIHTISKNNIFIKFHIKYINQISK